MLPFCTYVVNSNIGILHDILLCWGPPMRGGLVWGLSVILRKISGFLSGHLGLYLGFSIYILFVGKQDE